MTHRRRAVSGRSAARWVRLTRTRGGATPTGPGGLHNDAGGLHNDEGGAIARPLPSMDPAQTSPMAFLSGLLKAHMLRPASRPSALSIKKKPSLGILV